MVAGAAQVIALVSVTLKLISQEIEFLLEADKADVCFSIFFFLVALFNLLQVTALRPGMAFTYGKCAVGKIDEHFAALQIVHRNWFAGITLRRVGQHEHG